MPKDGFTTITIADRHYEHMEKWYNESRSIGVLADGVSSFTSFFVNKMEESIKEQLSMRKFVSKILYVPEEYTETKLIIKKTIRVYYFKD